ncbi:MAG: porin family protein [Methylococcaceae bacterium]|nr:porin family protein [Prolixibacteraceae bacterium]
MKKIILMIIATAFLINMTIAQEEVLDLRNKVTFGIKGGVNLSNVYDNKEKSFDTNAKPGLAAGAFLGLPLNTYIGIQPEVLYSQRGYKETGSFLNSKFTHTTNYLDVPLLLAIKPSPVLSILAGPQFSFLLNGKYDFQSDILSGQVSKDYDNENARKNTLCLTGGLDLNLENLVISGRAGWDLKENHADGSSTTPRYKNAWLQATIGFRF